MTWADRSMAAAAAVCLTIAMLVSCSTEPSSDDTTAAPPEGIIGALSADLKTLDFPQADDRNTQIIARLIGDSLIWQDARGQVIPRIATRWEWSEDHRTLTFHMRDDARWHDGRPVTAADVVYSAAVYSDPERAAPSVVSMFEQIASIVAVDDHTVVVSYAEALATTIRMWGEVLLPAHLADRSADAPDFVPVGCGPWKFGRWVHGERVIIEANPDYYDGVPKVPFLAFEVIRDYGLRLDALEAGKIHWAGLTPTLMREIRDDPESRKRFRIHRYELPYSYFIAWRMDGSNPFFADARVRRAMSHGIDRAGYLEKVQQGAGRPGVTYHPPPVAGFDADIEPWAFDPSKARRLLEEAGWIDTDSDGVREKNGRDFRFSLLYVAMGETTRIAEAVQAQLAAISVRMDLDPVDGAVFHQRKRARKFESLMSGFHFDLDPDPFYVLHSSQAASGFNHAGLKDDQIDAWIEEARRTFDWDARLAIYEKVQERVHQLEPVTHLFYPVSFLAVDRRIQGLETPVTGPLAYWPGAMKWRWSEQAD